MVKDFNDKKFTNVKEMCEFYHIHPATFHRRYHELHWSLKEALTRPIQNQKKVHENIYYFSPSFQPITNYPMREYIRYLKLQNERLTAEMKFLNIGEMTKAVIQEKIKMNERKMQGYQKLAEVYDIMDMIYAGKEKEAKEKYSMELFQKGAKKLLFLSDWDKVIYEDFTGFYHIAQHINH